jgi:cyclopropane fatty-acyl-phospholipid synthase-like methyltransferase
MSEHKFERLIRLLNLKNGSRVLDIACGKGEFLIRLTERYNISGVGVDISPYCIRDCTEKKNARIPKSDLEFVEMDGVDYELDSRGPFDVTMCIGASWIFQDHRGTVQALKKFTKSGGMILVGEPFWIKEPSKEYLNADGMRKEQFTSHYNNVKIGEEEGLDCIYTLVSEKDDWDHYETLQWLATDEFIKSYPEDKDIQDLCERVKKMKEVFLRWGRDTMGWAIYVFRNRKCNKE